MTTKQEKARSERIRQMDGAALDIEDAANRAIVQRGEAGSPATMQATGILSAIAAEKRRRDPKWRRGDESWIVGKWLPNDRIARGPDIPDDWAEHRKPDAVFLCLRRLWGEGVFARFFGFDSRRWDMEIRRLVGEVASREDALRRVAALEFRALSIGWANDVRNVQRAGRTDHTPSGVTMPAASRAVAAFQAAVWLKAAQRAPHKTDSGLAGMRWLLAPGSAEYQTFMTKFARALHDTVKPIIEADDCARAEAALAMSKMPPARQAIAAQREAANLARRAALRAVIKGVGEAVAGHSTE